MDRRYTRRSLLATGGAFVMASATGCNDISSNTRTTSGTFNDDGPNDGDLTIALYGGDWVPAEDAGRYALTCFGENTVETPQDVTLSIIFRDVDRQPLDRQSAELGVLEYRERFEFAFVYPGDPDDVERYLLTWSADEVSRNS